MGPQEDVVVAANAAPALLPLDAVPGGARAGLQARLCAMSLRFTLHDNPRYLHCETAGPATLADMRAGTDLARTLATNRGQRRILVDMRDVQHALTFSEHLQLGAYAAEVYGSMERVASVVRRETLVGVTAKAARKLGLQLRTFDDFDEATAWLQS